METFEGLGKGHGLWGLCFHSIKEEARLVYLGYPRVSLHSGVIAQVGDWRSQGLESHYDLLHACMGRRRPFSAADSRPELRKIRSHTLARCGRAI